MKDGTIEPGIIVPRTVLLALFITLFVLNDVLLKLVLTSIALVFTVNTYLYFSYRRRGCVDRVLWVFPASHIPYYVLTIVANHNHLAGMVVFTALVLTLMVSREEALFRELGRRISLLMFFSIALLIVLLNIRTGFYTFFILGPVLETIWISMFKGQNVYHDVLGLILIPLFYVFYPCFIAYVSVITVLKYYMMCRNRIFGSIMLDYVLRTAYGWFISLGL